MHTSFHLGEQKAADARLLLLHQRTLAQLPDMGIRLAG
jgi:hypothetical protein